MVTFLPSGGASLGIAAGMASVGMAAYSALHEWEKYSKQKLLSDTNLDIARSLSTEEPSLTPFVISLVSLGLEPLALLSAFNKARKLKALANPGEDTSALVNELNQIGSRVGKQGGKPKLGQEALEDIEAEQRASGAAKAAVPQDPEDQGHRVRVPRQGRRAGWGAQATFHDEARDARAVGHGPGSAARD